MCFCGVSVEPEAQPNNLLYCVEYLFVNVIYAQIYKYIYIENQKRKWIAGDFDIFSTNYNTYQLKTAIQCYSC